MRVGKIVVAEGLEPDEHSGASRQRHVADQRWIVGDVDRHRGTPDFLQRPQRSTQGMQVVAARTEIVVDEHCVRLAVRSKLIRNLLRMSHAVRHAQSVGRQIAKATPIVATPRRDQARSREETMPRQNRSGAARDLLDRSSRSRT